MDFFFLNVPKLELSYKKNAFLTCTLEVSLWLPCSRRRLLLPRRRKLKERWSGCPLSMLHRYTAHNCQSPQRGWGQHRIGMISCQASPPPHECHQTHWGDCRERKNAAWNKARGKQKRKRNNARGKEKEQGQRKLGKEKEQSQREFGKKNEQSQMKGGKEEH